MIDLIDAGYMSWVYGSYKNLGWEYFRAEAAAPQLPKSIWVVDLPGTTFRADYSPSYKSHREEKDDPEYLEKKSWVSRIRNSIMTHPLIYSIGIEKLEADDVIALFHLYGKPGETVSVIGVDKDLLQLEGIEMKDRTGKKKELSEWFISHTPKALHEYLKTEMDLLLVLSILGDKSDDIPRLLPPRQFDLMVEILTDRTPFVAAFHVFDAAFLDNLYMTVLPGPWVYETEILSVDLPIALETGSYYSQRLKPEYKRVLDETLLDFRTRDLKATFVNLD